MSIHIHLINPTERSIRTFKNHFIAGISSTDPNFLIQEWCQLLPQAEILLNMLRSSRFITTLSAYAQLQGVFDYNKTLFAPPPRDQYIIIRNTIKTKVIDTTRS